MNFKTKFATRTQSMNTSAIRELFKVVSQSGMISLAGGIPAPETFPIEIIKQLNNIVIEKYGSEIFQYGITEGFLPLRKAIKKYVERRGIFVSEENVCISTGAQNAIDAAAKTLIDKGDTIAVEAPTFLGSLKTFKSYEPNFVELEMDEDGVLPDSLEKAIVESKVKFAYLIPNYQNPTGRTVSLERRKKIADILIKNNGLIIEDDPYYELRYHGEALPTIKSLAPQNVIYIGSLSKIFSPGMRLGYYIAPKEISDIMTSIRQGVDVQANSYTQALAAEYITEGHLARHLPNILNIYRPRLDTMLNSLKTYFPSSFKWSEPNGGMFVWAMGPTSVHAKSIYEKAISQNVAFVPGNYFFVDETKGTETMRLNFTNVSEEKITKGIKTLSEVITNGL